jgi:gliding motility-associated-like protein
MKKVLYLLALCIHLNGFAQKQADWWYFGDKAGIHFVNNTPVAVTDGAMTTNEGSAVISNAAGKLLFYTNGVSAWDRSHSYVPNGFSLLGSLSSTQSAVCVPLPGDNFRYFLFTVDKEGGSNGFAYCVIDMTLNGGLGGLTLKDSILFSPSTEKITAVKHSNGIDYWVIGHKNKSKDFVAYLINSKGIQKNTPVISSVGKTHSVSDKYDNIGYMKSSPDGTKLAVAIHIQNVVEVLDFDPATGVVSNPTTLSLGNNYYPYGVEFSPDSKKLYITNIASPTSKYTLFQYDLAAQGNPVSTIYSCNYSMGALQLASNGRIYAAVPDSSSLSVINNPNMAGSLCDFQQGAVSLGGRVCTLGLPTFIQSFFVNNNFTSTNLCKGSYTQFQVTDSIKVDSVSWNFGDVNSAYNTDKRNSTAHLYSDTGYFLVKLYFYSKGFADSVVRNVYIHIAPFVSLGNDTNVCGQVNITYIAPSGYDLYIWSDGDSTQSTTINDTGMLICSVTNVCGTATDTINILAFGLASLGPDTTLCDSVKLVLDPGNAGNSYIWSTGDTSHTITILSSGTYWVDVSGTCGSQRDSIIVGLEQTPTFTITPLVYKCLNDSVVLSSGADNALVIWNTGDTSESIIAPSAGKYIVKASRSYCIDSMKVEVLNFSFQKLARQQLSWCDDTAAGITFRLKEYKTYSWQLNASPDSFLYVQQAGYYPVTVTDSHDCVQFDSMQATIVCPPRLYMANAFTPGNDQLNEYFKPVSQYVDKYTLYIYNRWGQLVYKGDQHGLGWDGTLNGSPCEQDLYMWWLHYEGDRSGSYRDSELLNGTVMLLRKGK